MSAADAAADGAPLETQPMSAADSADDGAAIEAELRAQLEEQVQCLVEVEEALQACPDDPELVAVQAQLQEAIAHLRDSLTEVHQHNEHQLEQLEQQQQEQQQLPQQDSAWDQHLGQQQQEHVRPRWLLPGVGCRFRYPDGLWHPGLIDEWAPQHQLPVSVSFAYPTRQHMLEHVFLPIGLVQHHPQAAAAASDSGSTSQQQLAVGSRVLVLPRGSRLWQPGEVTAVEQPHAGAADGADASHTQQQQHGRSRKDGRFYTVQLVSQHHRVLRVPHEFTVPAAAAAALSADQLEAADSAAAAAAAAAAVVGAGGGNSAAAGAGDDSGSDMSFSSGDEGGSSGGSISDDEGGSSSDSSGAVVRRLGGAGAGSSSSVLDHARAAAEAGVQSETVTFASWEASGRGIASKIMARMGFRRGTGLGRQGSGIKECLEIAVLPSKRGLGAAVNNNKGRHRAANTAADTTSSKHDGKKVSRRQRQRLRAAEARRAAQAGDRQRQSRMEAATGEQGLFAFINDSLGHGSEAAAKLAAAGVYGPDEGAGGGGSSNSRQRQQTGGGAALAAAAAAASAGGGGGGGGSSSSSSRKGLVGSQEGLAELKGRVSQLAAMLERNKGNKGLAPQISLRLAQAKRDYEAAAAQHKSLHKAVAAQEATKKWMDKF